MRILLCDDDPLMLEVLQNDIEAFFQQNDLKTPTILRFTSGEALLADSDSKDIVFLDIEMPGMNGIYVGNELKKRNKNTIIFVITSYLEYLDDAMRFHVFRYLSKPIDRQRLFRNLNDALNYYSSMTVMVPIETKNGVHTVLASQIIMIEAQGRKVIVYTVNKNYESIHKISWWIANLPGNSFYQTHRSFVVNFRHITDFDHTTIHVTNPAITAYLTRRKYSSFKDSYLLYLESFR